MPSYDEYAKIYIWKLYFYYEFKTDILLIILKVEILDSDFTCVPTLDQMPSST